MATKVMSVRLMYTSATCAARSKTTLNIRNMSKPFMGWAIALHHKSSPTAPALFGSLASKLTLAFLLVGVLGVLVFALMLGQRTRMEFVRFLSDRDQELMLEALSNYYTENGNWSGVRQVLAVPPLNAIAREIVLVNADGAVVMTSRAFRVGDHIA